MALPLVPNILAAVCSPALARTLRRPGDLKQTTLLHTMARPDDWQHWLQSAGLKDMDGLRHRNYESSTLVYQAAIEGQGVGIAQKALVQPLIDSGDLVFPFAHELDMKEYTYYFVRPANRPIRPELQSFQDWLRSSA
ncbi:LysR substrate-binding domain-containing protein [Bordetella sp. 15P40C-2]|uniref:LysR substrate-binding domain-containing protein n=1 Tax=Bordetella sp. 15P40C-2 TaxID=2572246 RepID=UPI00132AF2CA|nr:hypothetical protein [Bordetella sp. 15P40C-2]